MPTAVKSWKFLVERDGKIVSDYGAHKDTIHRTVWEVGEWKHQDGIIRACHRGFHHSNNPYDALSYVSGSVLARVEVKGTRASDDDEWSDETSHKEAVSDMRIVKAGAWGKHDSVALTLHIAQFAVSWLNSSYLRVTTEEKRMIHDALTAVRHYVHTGKSVTRSIAPELSNASYRTRHAAVSAVMDAVYQAVNVTGPEVSPTHAGDIVSYAASNATRAVDGGHYRHSTVKAAANEWMENRFKTLPRL